MPRAPPLRKALLALVVLTIFMFVLRLSRPAPGIGDIDKSSQPAASVTPNEASEAAKANAEAAKAAANAQKDSYNDMEAAKELAKAANDGLEPGVKPPSDAVENRAATLVKLTTETKPTSLTDTAKTSHSSRSQLAASSAASSKPSSSGKPRTPTSKDKPKKEPSSFDAAAAFKEIVHGPNSPPVVIFSKSYCPHSMRAKNLLLEAHAIQPAPLVVELDKMDHGSEMQDYLNEISGRRTVPNIFVNGESRGGASEMSELGENLAEQFKIWSNNQFTITVQQARVDNDASGH